MTTQEVQEVSKLLRTIEDFPEKGVIFRDITTVLKDKKGLQIVIKDFTERYKDQGIDYVLGADARGFIFGAAIAYNIGAGFVPARKPGKLPREVVEYAYDLEYGSAELHLHKDAVKPGQKVLICDDLLATGGTMAAAAKLVEKLGGEVVGLAFLVELTDLKGREKISEYDIFTLMEYTEDER